MRPHGNVEAAIAVGENVLEIRPVKRLASFKEDMDEFFGDELVYESFPLLGRELGTFARATVRVAKLAVHAASLGDADRQLERLFESRNASRLMCAVKSDQFVHPLTSFSVSAMFTGPKPQRGLQVSRRGTSRSVHRCGSRPRLDARHCIRRAIAPDVSAAAALVPLVSTNPAVLERAPQMRWAGAQMRFAASLVTA